MNTVFGRRISAKPTLQFVMRHLGLARSCEEVASEKVVICPEERNPVAAAIHLNGQLDRVTGVDSYSSFELENLRLAGRDRLDVATVAYRIDGAVFSSGRLLTGRMRHDQGGAQRTRPFAKVTGELDTAVLPLSSFATMYFGHMIFDGGATALMAPDFGQSYVDAKVAADMAGHVSRYWDLFGLSYEAVGDVRIRHAWIFEDRGMNSHKIARLENLSARVRALPGTRDGHGIFIRRRGWGAHRAPANEAALEDFFAAQGYEIIDPRHLTVDQIVARARGAQVLVGVEGSGMTHGMLAMAPGTSLIMLFPPWRLNNMMKDYADGLGMKYGFVVGEGRGEDYYINPDEILRTIDLVQSSEF